MAIPKLKVNDRLEILWNDAHDCSEDGKTWMVRDDPSMPTEAYEVLSLGYFLKQENGFIYIAGDLNNVHVSRIFAIPRGCIKAVKRL